MKNLKSNLDKKSIFHDGIAIYNSIPMKFENKSIFK